MINRKCDNKSKCPEEFSHTNRMAESNYYSTVIDSNSISRDITLLHKEGKDDIAKRMQKLQDRNKELEHKMRESLNIKETTPKIEDITEVSNDQTQKKNTSCFILQIVLFILIPIRMCGIYYCDVLSDILQMLSLYNNCHLDFFITSLLILVTSHMITVVYVKVHSNLTRTSALFYPWIFE